MKTKTASILLAALLCAAGALAAPPPSVEDVRSQILPPLVIQEVADIRMAGLDAPDEVRIADLSVIDMTAWIAANCYQISFRVFLTATEDVYVRALGQNDAEGEISLVRCGRAGRSYAERWEEIDIESKTVLDEQGREKTVYALKNPHKGTVEWDFSVGVSFAATKSCWEAQAAVTGERLKFYASPDQLPVR